MKAKWKKADAGKVARSIAEIMAKEFGVPVPTVLFSDDRNVSAFGTTIGKIQWEWRFESGTIQTKAGAAEMRFRVSAEFAHMFFRFDDPARAIECGFSDWGRLNRYSGKWNDLEVPPNCLNKFSELLARDFARVAEPNLRPAEIEA
jgi:hypothetical protein